MVLDNQIDYRKYDMREDSVLYYKINILFSEENFDKWRNSPEFLEGLAKLDEEFKPLTDAIEASLPKPEDYRIFLNCRV